jgi:hypothetical protein
MHACSLAVRLSFLLRQLPWRTAVFVRLAVGMSVRATDKHGPCFAAAPINRREAESYESLCPCNESISDLRIRGGQAVRTAGN